MQRILDVMTDAPADVRNGRQDILATNRLGYALYAEMYVDPVRPANVARFVFLSPRAHARVLPRLGACRQRHHGQPRTEAGRNAYDRGLPDLVGELAARSEEFRTGWAAHNVRYHTGRKHLHHPVVGDLELTYEVMDSGRPRAVAGGGQRRARFRLPGRPEAPGELGGGPRPARPAGNGPGAHQD